ncbi:MAG: DUF2726 domain-containing protein [Anaerolineae bacterium]|nr:DUF2726 domain-containing protein [Anaerolineae bacterium]
MSAAKKQGCLGAILQLFKAPSSTGPVKEEIFPYRLRDDFLSYAELSFYHVLQQAVSDWAVVCPKISLDDLFYAKSGQRGSNQAYTNKIDRKHVDFLLCHPRTMRPLLGIELDDASHQKSSRQERDRFVEKVFAAAGLPLFRQSVRSTYNVGELAVVLKQLTDSNEAETGRRTTPETPQAKMPVVEAAAPTRSSQKFESSVAALSLTENGTPRCPQCGELMVLRTVQKEGPHKGNKFWGCKDYPRCRGMRPFTES